MITTDASWLFAYRGLYDVRAGVVYELLFPNWSSANVVKYTPSHAHVVFWHYVTCSCLGFEFFLLSVSFFRSTMRCVSSVLFTIRSDKKEAFHVFSYSWWKMELLANWENIFSVLTLQQPIRLRYHELSSLKKRSMSFWEIRHFNINHAEYSSFWSHGKCLLTRGSCPGY